MSPLGLGDEDRGKRLQGLSFSTRRGDGFSEGSVTLARRIDRDYVDLSLFDDVSFVGADGSVAYEGRVAAMPRSLHDGHRSASCSPGGWRTRGTCRFVRSTSTGICRRGSRRHGHGRLRCWQGIWGCTGSSPRGMPGAARRRCVMNIQGAWVSPYKLVSEAVYDAGPGVLDRVGVRGVRGRERCRGERDVHSAVADRADRCRRTRTRPRTCGLGRTPLRTSTSPTTAAYSCSERYASTPAGADGATWSLAAKNLDRCNGTHGLQLYGADPAGIVASDVIKDIAGRFCPKLNTAGVQPTTWPIPHLVFRDQTDPLRRVPGSQRVSSGGARGVGEQDLDVRAGEPT